MGIISSRIFAKLADNIAIEQLLADNTVLDISLYHLVNELIVRNVITVVDSYRDLKAKAELVIQVEAVEPRLK